MHFNLAYNIDPHLKGYQGKALRHKSTGAPDSQAEHHMFHLLDRVMHQYPDKHLDDAGRPLPLPPISNEDWKSFVPKVKPMGAAILNLGPRKISSGNAPRKYKIVRFPDHSSTVMEKLDAGLAVLPIALFSDPKADGADKEQLLDDLNAYSDASRGLPPSITLQVRDPMKWITPQLTIPHWLPFRNFGDFAPRTKEAFYKLARFYAYRIATTAPQSTVYFSMSGRGILRDGTTAPVFVSAKLTNTPLHVPDLAGIQHEFSTLLNHASYAEEHNSLCINTSAAMKGFLTDPIFTSSTNLGLTEAPSAHEIIERSHEAQPWLNP